MYMVNYMRSGDHRFPYHRKTRSTTCHEIHARPVCLFWTLTSTQEMFTTLHKYAVGSTQAKNKPGEGEKSEGKKE